MCTGRGEKQIEWLWLWLWLWLAAAAVWRFGCVMRLRHAVAS